MSTRGRAGSLAAAVGSVMFLGGCIAPDVEVIGAVGVMVDAQQRPVLVLEACDGATTRVGLSFDREGLTESEENEMVGEWLAAAPVPGISELVLGAPPVQWVGGSVELRADRGYIADAAGEGDDDVLTQVAFRGGDIAGLQQGMVYTNAAGLEDFGLRGRNPEAFSRETCDR